MDSLHHLLCSRRQPGKAVTAIPDVSAHSHFSTGRARLDGAADLLHMFIEEIFNETCIVYKTLFQVLPGLTFISN